MSMTTDIEFAGDESPEPSRTESGGYLVQQIPLFAAICRHLDKEQVIKLLNSRQMNSIIKAANLIVDELGKGHRPAPPSCGIVTWMSSDETGLSSMFMCRVMCGNPRIGGEGRLIENEHPHDAGDLGRCVTFLDACPDVRPRLSMMAEHGPVWASLVNAWNELESLYREEKPDGKFDRLYDRLQEVIKGASS